MLAYDLVEPSPNIGCVKAYNDDFIRDKTVGKTQLKLGKPHNSVHSSLCYCVLLKITPHVYKRQLMDAL